MRSKEVVIWEISCIWFSWNRQANWWKVVYLSFRRSAAGAGAVCPWKDYMLHQFDWCTISNHLLRKIFYSQKGESSPDGGTGRRFVLLLGAAACYNSWATDWTNRQRIWNLFLAYLKSKTSIHLWNAYGSGMERRLYLLFTESGKQPCKQSTEKIEGFPWSAGLCKKRLRYRL